VGSLKCSLVTSMEDSRKIYSNTASSTAVLIISIKLICYDNRIDLSNTK